MFREGRCRWPGAEDQQEGAEVWSVWGMLQDWTDWNRGSGAPGAQGCLRMFQRACKGERGGRLKLRNSEGGAYGRGEEEGEGGLKGVGVGEWGERRLPLLPGECAACAAPTLPSRLQQVRRSKTEKTPPAEAEMLLSPNFPFLPPHLSSSCFPRVWAPTGRSLRGKKTAKDRGIFPFHPYTTTPPTSCFPTTAAQCRWPLRSLEAAATYRLLPEAKPPRGGRGEPPPPAHLPRLWTLRLRWRAGRHCPRPRKPPAPPAAAEASQRLRITTAAVVAVAALLPRGSRSAPASTGAGPTAR